MYILQVLYFKVSFIGYGFDYYIFILGGGIEKKKIVQFSEINKFSFQITYLQFLNYSFRKILFLNYPTQFEFQIILLLSNLRFYFKK